MKGYDLRRIHPTAIIGQNAVIGSDVTIAANSIVYDNVHIGEGTVIGPHSIIGEPTAQYYSDPGYISPQLVIGPRSLIRSGAIIYAGVTIGEQFECGHRVTIREHAQIGAHCRIGTLSDVQGYCKIGDYCRLHSSVHIGQASQVGNFVWIYPYTVLTNDPQPPSNILTGVIVEDFAVIATHSLVLPGLKIGKDALIGAKALVRDDVPPEAVMVGIPARQRGTIRDIRSRETGESMYPWREHFERGMPWEGLGYERWAACQLQADPA